MTLNPIMSDQISYERPVGAAPSVFESVLGTLVDLGQSYAEGTAGNASPESEKNKAISAFTREMDELESMNLPQREFETRAQALRRRYMGDYGQWHSDFAAVSANEFGVEQGQGDFARGVIDNANKWAMEHPMGQLSAQRNVTIGVSGVEIRDQGQNNIVQDYLEFTAREAKIAGFELSEKEDAVKWDELAPSWTKTAVEQANGLLMQAGQNPQLLEKPEQVLQVLEEATFSLRTSIIQEGQAAGISTTLIQQKIDDALAPLTNLKTMYTNSMENIGLFAEAVKKANDLELTRELASEFGIMGTSPEWQRIWMENFLHQSITKESAANFFKKIDERVRDYNSFDFAVDGLPGVNQAVTRPDTTTRPEKVSDFRRQGREDPDFFPTRVTTAVVALGHNPSTPEGQQMVYHALQELAVIGEAYEGPLGEGTLRAIFNPENVKNINLLGEQGKVMMSTILSQQVRQYRHMLSGSTEIMSNTRVTLRDGQFVAQRRFKLAGKDAEWNDISSGSMHDYTKALNFIRAVAQQVPGVAKALENSTQFRFRGVEPEPDMLDQDISWDDLENVQHTSASAPNALVSLIDRTEGGGEYDTLFGFSQRGGGQFSGVKIDEMTIGQVLEFSDPSGPYGQWVKGEVGRVATPMGRYQIVGTTLREAANQMGLAPNIVFNKRTQDAIFHFLAERRVRGKTGAAARKALRQEWEGFQSVPDSELDRAIAAFKGTPPPSIDNLATANGSGGGVPDIGSDSPTARQSNGFMAAWAKQDTRGIVPSASRFNPKVDETGGTQITEESRASRLSTEEARRQVVATLTSMGYSDDEISEVIAGQKQA